MVSPNAGDHEFDPDDIGFWGQSAGAHLALLAGLSNENAFAGDPELRGVSARVAYVIDNFGPADLPRLLGGIVAGERAPGMVQRRQLQHMFDSTYQDDPPALIVHGDSDTLVPHGQSLSLQKRMVAAGAKHELSLIEGVDHSFNGATQIQVADIIELSMTFIERRTSDTK